MTAFPPERVTELRNMLAEATDGPWEHGDRQKVAGVLPDNGNGPQCVYCFMGKPSWSGRRPINGRTTEAHVHTCDEPWWNHGIYAIRDDGSFLIVNDAEEYGYIDQPDAALIVAAVNALPELLDELERLARWKSEAIQVLNGWDRVHEALGSPGALGQSKHEASAVEVERRKGQGNG